MAKAEEMFDRLEMHRERVSKECDELLNWIIGNCAVYVLKPASRRGYLNDMEPRQNRPVIEQLQSEQGSIRAIELLTQSLTEGDEFHVGHETFVVQVS